MLIIGRGDQERVRIQAGAIIIWVQVLCNKKTHYGIKLGIDAPAEVEIMREELLHEDQS